MPDFAEHQQMLRFAAEHNALSMIVITRNGVWQVSGKTVIFLPTTDAVRFQEPERKAREFEAFRAEHHELNQGDME